MSSVNVLVVFYSRYGEAERLALAAGVGAVQARGSIRLRRLADLSPPDAIAAIPAWQEHLARMRRDYVAPRPADPEWADVIVLATSVDTSAEVEAYCADLRASGVAGGKLAATLAAGNSEVALRPVFAAAACAGLVVVPAELATDDPVGSARAFGQHVTRMARALKNA